MIAFFTSNWKSKNKLVFYKLFAATINFFINNCIFYNTSPLSALNFFRVNDDNIITTFINRLLDRRRFVELSAIELIDPTDKISNMMKQIRIRLGNMFKNRYGNFDLFDQIFSNDNRSLHFEMVSIIMENIMNRETTEDQIISEIIDIMNRKFFF